MAPISIANLHPPIGGTESQVPHPLFSEFSIACNCTLSTTLRLGGTVSLSNIQCEIGLENAVRYESCCKEV